MQLRLQGIDASEEVIDDPEMLMSIMTAREAIEEAEDSTKLQKFQQDFEQKAGECNQASNIGCTCPLQ